MSGLINRVCAKEVLYNGTMLIFWIDVPYYLQSTAQQLFVRTVTGVVKWYNVAFTAIAAVTVLVIVLGVLNADSVDDPSEIRYGADPLQKMDVSSPAGGGKHPAVVYVHGGGWTSGDKSEGEGYKDPLNRMGCVYVSVNYRFLCEGVTLVQILDDINSAVALLRDRAEEFGIDVSRMGVIGSSAGGYLSMMYAYSVNSPIPVSFVVSCCGPSDLTDPDFYRNISANFPDNVDFGMISANALAGKSFTLAELSSQTEDSFKPELMACSPVKYIDGKQPKTLLAYGLKDNIVSKTNAERIVAKLEATESRFDYVPYPNSGHGLDDPADWGPRAEYFRLLVQYVSELTA